MNLDQEALLRGIVVNPFDMGARLVYCDWLMENGQWELGEKIMAKVRGRIRIRNGFAIRSRDQAAKVHLSTAWGIPQHWSIDVEHCGWPQAVTVWHMDAFLLHCHEQFARLPITEVRIMEKRPLGDMGFRECYWVVRRQPSPSSEFPLGGQESSDLPLDAHELPPAIAKYGLIQRNMKQFRFSGQVGYRSVRYATVKSATRGFSRALVSYARWSADLPKLTGYPVDVTDGAVAFRVDEMIPF